MPTEFSDTFISIVIPAFNEEKRLPQFLDEIIPYCEKAFHRFEIIVVDDGSKDRTFLAVQEMQKLCPQLQCIKLPGNRGKGHAVKRGMLEASGEIVVFMDADGSMSVSEIGPNLHHFAEGYDIVIGSRVLASQKHRVETKTYRKRIGQVFNFLVRILLIKDIQDTQCGFKMFRRDIVRPLFCRIYIRDFGFDLELFYLAKKMKLKIKAVPVNWKHMDGSKVNIFKDALKMFVNIFQIKIWHCSSMNVQEKFMTSQETQSMYELERKHWWFVSKGRLVERLIQNTRRSFDRILDAGCGTGGNYSILKPFGRYTGCDVFSEAIDFCVQNKVTDITRCQIEELPFKNESFDLITSLDVIEHVENPEKTLREFWRVLKPEGYAIITVPAFRFLWSDQDDALCHLRRYSKNDLRLQLNDAGFHVQNIGYFFFSTFWIIVLIRKFRTLFMPGAPVESNTGYYAPGWLNAFLIRVFAWESKFVLKGSFPWGTTVFAIATKTPVSQQVGAGSQPAQLQMPFSK